MYKDFKEMPDNSKIWVFQSDRVISETENQKLDSGLREFCENWSSHGQPLEASFTLKHNLFVILCANDSQIMIGGCSIDSSVKIIKKLQCENSLNFFRREQVAVFENEKINLYSTFEIKNRIICGKLSEDVIIFDNIIKCKADIGKHWMKPIKESWMAKYINQQVQ